MKRLMILILLIISGLGCGGSGEKSAEPFDREEAVAACEKIIGDFQAVLKQELVAAMAEGGPENAIAVCNTKAPMVADSFSQMPGISIRRVSLRQRNAGFRPDDFETIALETFATAETSEPQSHSELVFDSADVRRFRYMKEIKTGELCLKCHGDPGTFSKALKAVLAQHYPDDPAVGYQVGESRGAFSVSVTYPEADETIKLLLGGN